MLRVTVMITGTSNLITTRARDIMSLTLKLSSASAGGGVTVALAPLLIWQPGRYEKSARRKALEGMALDFMYEE